MRRMLFAAVLLSAGCVTAWQDGHADACANSLASSIAGNAVDDQLDCDYFPFEAPEIADPDAYERGYLDGWEDCVVRTYREEWLEADEASPCAEVSGEDPR